MQIAIDLLWTTIGKTAPNPPVAAIIVKNNKVIGQGVHLGAGSIHAEHAALKNCIDDPRGADLYVTLEPCDHKGRTGRCTSLILQAGIHRVFYGWKDENSSVKGGGANTLISSGVMCQNMFSPDCLIVYQAFFKWANTNESSITLKVAYDKYKHMALNSGDSFNITSDFLNNKVAHWRSFHDAILTTDVTVKNDNPRLNSRLGFTVEYKPIIVLAKTDVFDHQQNIFNGKQPVVLFLPEGLSLKDEKVKKISEINYFHGNFLAWADLKKITCKLGFHRIWAEVGASSSRYMINHKVPDDIMFLTGKTACDYSKHNLQDIHMPNYKYSNECFFDLESLLYVGDTKFPELFLNKERNCLPGL